MKTSSLVAALVAPVLITAGSAWANSDAQDAMRKIAEKNPAFAVNYVMAVGTCSTQQGHLTAEQSGEFATGMLEGMGLSYVQMKNLANKEKTMKIIRDYGGCHKFLEAITGK